MPSLPNAPLGVPPPGVIPNLAPTTQPLFTSVAFVLLALSTVTLVLRLYTRFALLRTVGPDDYLLLSAWVLTTASTACSQAQVRYGLGRHTWDFNVANMPMFLKLLTPAMCLYIISMMLVKLSLLFLYRRVSTSANQVFTIFWWVTAAIVVLYSVPFAFLSVLNCRPARAAWDITLLPTAHCINTNYMLLAHGTFNTLTDFAILALPVPIVLSLTIPPRQKVVLMLLFALGSFTCIVSIYRLTRLAQESRVWGDSNDWTQSSLTTTIWSLVELNFAMICASAIALRPLFRKYFGVLLSNYYGNSSGGTSTGGISKDRSRKRHSKPQFLPAEVALGRMAKIPEPVEDNGGNVATVGVGDRDRAWGTERSSSRPPYR